MPDTRDFGATLQRYSEIPMDRLRVAYDFEQIGLSEMQRGIVFLFARWSGPSIAGFRKLTRVLSALPVTALDVVIIDHDLVSEVYLDNAPFSTGGNAETVWIRDGIVVAREIAAPTPEELLRRHTLDLLK